MKVYLNNPNLKAAGVEIPFEKWQVEELAKCYNDPIYFIENYIKIVSIDKGLVPFKLYDYQKKIVKTSLDNRKVIMKLPRQSGKCASGDTIITLQQRSSDVKSSLQQPITMKIVDFYEWQRFREFARLVLEEHSAAGTEIKEVN